MLVSATPYSLEQLTIEIAQRTNSNYELQNRTEFSLLLQKQFCNFTQSHGRAWCRQFAILYSRRSRLLWLSFRNSGGAFILFFSVLFTSYIFRETGFYFFFKLLDSFDIIIVEEIVQRSLKKMNLSLSMSGVSSFQYQLANLLAHSTFFLFAYYLLYLILQVGGKHFLSYSFDSLVFVLILIPGVLASTAFIQFVALLFKEPKLGLGIFSLFVTYISFFLFYYSFYLGLLLPVTFFSFVITKHVSTETQADVTNTFTHFQLDDSLQVITFVCQALGYFVASVLLDSKQRGNPKYPCRGNTRRFDYAQSSPLQLNFNHTKRSNLNCIITLEKGNMAALLGPAQSGKSEIINLLAGISRSSFEGSCKIMGKDLLRGDTLPSNEVGVCLDQDYLEESFSLFYHLYYIGQLKGLSNKQMMQQIFYLSKLFDMEQHLFKKIKHLSGGHKRKAALASALLGAPPLLIIDEPTRSLDPAVSRQVLLALHFFVHSFRNTVLFSSKKLSQVLLVADSVITLPSPQVKPLGSITNERVEQTVALIVHFTVNREEHRVRIKMEDVSSRLLEIFQRISEEEEEVIAISLNSRMKQ